MIHKTTGTDLGYNIAEEQLTGSIDGVEISARAVSGGRAGSTAKGAEHPVLANNPFLTGIKEKGKRPGGPLIMGTYELHTHETRANWIRLNPTGNTKKNMRGRAGFAIHGRGKVGSQGCIVPTDFHVVRLLYKLVKAREEAGEPAPTITVFAVGDLDYYERKINLFLHTV